MKPENHSLKLISSIILFLLVLSFVYPQPEEDTTQALETESQTLSQSLGAEDEALSPPLESAGGAFSKGFSAVNAFFTGEGIKRYSRIIDFIVFFIIFTTVFLIGLRTAFKDKAISKQINALAVVLGLMSTLALMFGGTFLGKEISIVSLFPFALWFLIGFIPFAILYWLLHLMMGKKHPILAFLLALLIAGLIVFLFFVFSEKFREPSVPGVPGAPGDRRLAIPFFKKGEPPLKGQYRIIKGYFVEDQKEKFADDRGQDTLTEIQRNEIRDLILSMGSQCKVHIETGAGEELESNLPPDSPLRDKDIQRLNAELARGRCLFLQSLARKHYNNEECNKQINNKLAYKFTKTDSYTARLYKIECKEAGGYKSGKGPGSCAALTSFNIDQFIKDIDGDINNILSGTGKSKREELKRAFEQCKKEKDERGSTDPEVVLNFYDATMNYYGEFAKKWFEAGRFDEAKSELESASTATTGTGANVANSEIKDKLLKLWYDDLIAEDLKKLVNKAKDIKDKTERDTRLGTLENTATTLKQKRDNNELADYTRP